MATITYKFGALQPLDWGDDCCVQMKLQTDLWNALVKIHHDTGDAIRSLTPAQLEAARQSGQRWKLLCTARREGNSVVSRVAPALVSANSPLYSINGTSSYVQFETDVLPGLGIVENNPGPDTTAYGLLADLINALRGG